MTDPGPATPKGPPPLPAPPATQPFPPAPSVATNAQLTELAKVIVRKLDGHGARVDDRLDVFHQELAMLRQAVAGNADTLPAPAPKSLGALAFSRTVTAGKYLFILTGAVGFAMQVAAAFKPSLVSPLQHLQQFLNALGGGQ